ncbi:MAG TPA: DUF3040 domain-containing protein [Marmoricola sp.]|nr:DUF3040 domain-containing protein [Marmoricola sp.]
MPLSEEELRLLEQMERELAAEDPKFVATLRGRSLHRSARFRLILAGVVFLGGVALMMGGAMSRMTWLGILGFLVMLGSATLGLAAWRGQHPSAEPTEQETVYGLDERNFSVIDGGRSGKPAKKQRRPKNKPQGTFLQRMEQRWEQRRNQGGF